MQSAKFSRQLSVPKKLEADRIWVEHKGREFMLSRVPQTMDDRDLHGNPRKREPIMTNELDDAKLETVAERPMESAALILVSVLKDAGIRAIATGGFTAGFRAEAPGMVKVQTFEADAERARQVIAEIRELATDESDDQTTDDQAD